MYTFFVNYILGILPTWIWPVFAGAGAAVYFMAGAGTILPALVPFTRFVRPVSFLIFCASLFMWGGAEVKDVYQSAVDQQKAKVAAANQASQDANVQLQKTIESNNKLIAQKSFETTKTIKDNAKDLDKTCTLTSSTIALYNNIVNNSGAKSIGGSAK